MSDERTKTGLIGPTGSPVKSDPGGRRTSRTSEKSAEGGSPAGSVGLQKKGKDSPSPRTAGPRSVEGEVSGSITAPGGYDPKSPPIAYNPRSPPNAYDARSPPAAQDTRSPPATAYAPRSPAPAYDPRSPPGTYDPRSPPGTYDPRSPPGTYDPRSPPGTYDARSPPDAYDSGPQGSPMGVPEEEAEEANPSPGGTPVQPEAGSRRSTAASAQPSSGKSVAEEGTVNPNDAFNAEFSYYCAVLRTYAPSLSREYDKATTRLWMRKLFGPEYHPTVLKPKRNKYLLYLSITIYNDEAYGIFKQEPPCGKLPEISDIPFDRDFPPAAWETEVQWTDTLADLPDELKMSECYLHDRDACPAPDEQHAGTLDAEFQFFLWLAKPYVTLLPDPEEKTTAACWIRLLCGVASQREDCVGLKEIRNDYMQALLGYVHDLRVEGPFRLMPPAGPLPPLALLYEDCLEDSEFADPAGNQAQEFLSIQRLPESGAFAYINVTGELFGNL